MDALEQRAAGSLGWSISLTRPIQVANDKLKQAREMSYAVGNFVFECIRPWDNRVYVSGLFAERATRLNWKAVQNPVEDNRIYRDNLSGNVQRYWDSFASFAGEGLKKPICKLTAINGFLYSLFLLNYSKERGFYF